MTIDIEDLQAFANRRAELRAALDGADWATTMAATQAGIITAQSLGFRAEKAAAKAFGWTRVPVVIHRGDLLTPDGEFVELKTTTGPGGTLMLRQIRTSQRVNWLLVFAGTPFGETEIFALDRLDVEHESRDMDAAHGVRATASELAMTFDRSSEIYHRWMANYHLATVRELDEAADVVNDRIRP
ncbi:hypothetical protein SAMN02982929_07182 [Saccharopolyspora kobensis]|uniref:Uncharacterized protein n=1 Tax=Saccharopolyspora kobensis TaxID=146035 RepID=A0A1H6ELF0_9PSEU|nr:hypothetical protein [Saccharopolyspora kobensis]SEG98678.1 hypothetical protein SAMN02982929_07182 [Saccharopolyspora kobensis]SFD23890.1 hypothetical protein SAMN05216506_103187 [Saccharopolyspora kobensis]